MIFNFIPNILIANTFSEETSSRIEDQETASWVPQNSSGNYFHFRRIYLTKNYFL